MRILLQLLLLQHQASAILFPRDSGSRESKSLDGLWKFKLSPKDDPDIGFRESWYSAPLQAIVNHRHLRINSRLLQGDDVLLMPVPSSYNDITTDSAVSCR